ncbi:unnamed protein product [Microthlaspi erraticum]|uniref:Secreted protein n=1 Tax=Microthlaspi erraticum TaxID=1685480 RepID=A0A6D2IME1_9BRAS|nr:unnamed protein product [Microthlaspi erraticum]
MMLRRHPLQPVMVLLLPPMTLNLVGRQATTMVEAVRITTTIIAIASRRLVVARKTPIRNCPSRILLRYRTNPIRITPIQQLNLHAPRQVLLLIHSQIRRDERGEMLRQRQQFMHYANPNNDQSLMAGTSSPFRRDVGEDARAAKHMRVGSSRHEHGGQEPKHFQVNDQAAIKKSFLDFVKC